MVHLAPIGQPWSGRRLPYPLGVYNLEATVLRGLSMLPVLLAHHSTYLSERKMGVDLGRSGLRRIAVA